MVRESEMAERIMFPGASSPPTSPRRSPAGPFQNLRDEARRIGFLKCISKDFGKLPWRIGGAHDDQDLVILHACRSGFATFIYTFATWLTSFDASDYPWTYYYMAWITGLMWVSLTISVSWAIIADDGSANALKIVLCAKLAIVITIMIILLRALTDPTIAISLGLLFVLFGIPLVLFCTIYGGFLGEVIRTKCYPPDPAAGPLMVDTDTNQSSVPAAGFRVDIP